MFRANIHFDEAQNVCVRIPSMALPNLHFPNLSLAKMLSSLLAIALFLFVAVSAVSGFLVYQIVRPQRVAASYDLSVMMGHPVTMSFPVAGGGSREGFFFPGVGSGLRRLWCATGMDRSARMC